jgi:hypothetical protein
MSGVAEVVYIEKWDKRDGHNISRHLECPNGKIIYLQPYSPDYKPYTFIDLGPDKFREAERP